MKIISKECIDAKVIKKYDRAWTPYARLVEYEDLDKAAKDELRRRKNSLDLSSSFKNLRNSRTGCFSWPCPEAGDFG